MKNRTLHLVLLTIGLGLLAACTAPTTPMPISTSAAPTAALQSMLIPTRLPPTVPASASVGAPTGAPAVSGTYPLGRFGLKLQVVSNGTAVLQAPATHLTAATSWSGVWTRDNQGAVITLTARADGTPLSRSPAIKVGVISGTLQVTALGVNGQFYDRSEWGFALTNGLKHAQVTTLNQLLAKVPYLNYTAPLTNTDAYNELVRRAVARFQATEGLESSGATTPDTWLHLLGGSYAQVPSSPVKFTITNDVVNIRSGPGTSYAVIDRRYRGETLDIVGKVSGATSTSTWLQLCCVGKGTGWVESDLGTMTGSLVQVPEIQPDQLPPTPTAAPAGQQTSRARSGEPLLANLPSYTADGHPVAYFTFDDGPNGTYTQQMLDVLKQYNAHATFCLVGNEVGPGTDMTRAEAAAQHYLCNHTWDHTSLEDMPEDQFVQEADKTKQAILQAAGDLFTLDKDVRLLRPPYGATDGNTRQYAANLGYDILIWDVDPQDWSRPGVDAIVSNVLTYTFPGAVVLMHDGGGDRSQSIAALQQILQALSKEGYVFYNIYGN